MEIKSLSHLPKDWLLGPGLPQRLTHSSYLLSVKSWMLTSCLQTPNSKTLKSQHKSWLQEVGMGEVKVSSVSHACVSVATRDQQRELVCLFFPLEVITLYPYNHQVAVIIFFWPIFLDFAEVNNSTIKFNIFWVRIMYKMLQSIQRRLLSLIIE